jgi:hypothetical protein
MPPNKNDYFTTETETDSFGLSFNTGVVNYINSQLEFFRTARVEREETWLECWAMYLNSSQARNWIKSQAIQTIGEINNDWRHNLNTGKAYEQVETVVAYLQQAFFPNRDWFDAVPAEPGYQDLADVVKAYTKKQLTVGAFMSKYEMFLRQMVITGGSILALPWRFETAKFKKKVKVEQPQLEGQEVPHKEKVKFEVVEEERAIVNRPEFEVLSVFDCYLDPEAISVSESDFCRRLVRTKAELMDMVNSGYYKNVTPLDVVKAEVYAGASATSAQERANDQLIHSFQGITLENGFNWNQRVELYEYWGDITVDGTCYRDVVATIMGDKVLRFENNPYWCGKPFVYGTYTPVNFSISSLGILEPSLGLLHEFNILTNQRLDNLELSIDSMWEYVNDGTLQPEDIFTKPGRVFPVSEQGTITPIQMPQAYTITYDESAVLESRIDKIAGTGSLISANAARDAERVTAAEVRATRQAGGNRLSGVHKHIEETAMMPLLDKLFKLFQQFENQEHIVRVPGQNPDDFDYVSVGEEELQYDFKLTPVGADHVADSEYDVQQRLQFLQVVSSRPEMSEHINYYNFMLDLARRMGIDDIDQFIQEGKNKEMMMQQMAGGQGGGQQPQQPPTANQEEATMQQQLQQVAGVQGANAVQGNLEADGGASMMETMFGVNAPAAPPQPPQEQQ